MENPAINRPAAIAAMESNFREGAAGLGRWKYNEPLCIADRRV